MVALAGEKDVKLFFLVRKLGENVGATETSQTYLAIDMDLQPIKLAESSDILPRTYIGIGH